MRLISIEPRHDAEINLAIERCDYDRRRLTLAASDVHLGQLIIAGLFCVGAWGLLFGVSL
jgi:hypothetical protein